jgi:hypothetical protein
MAIIPLDERRFNALAGYTRSPMLVRYAQEYDWLATDDERVLGILTWDRFDRDFGWIALGRDERRQYRAVEVNSSKPTTEEARAELLAAMERLQAAPDEEFYQGDEVGEPVDFFAPVVPTHRLHPNFRMLVDHPRYSPARELIAAMMPYFEDADGNFIEQFQTTGFDPRVWELYLYATFTELGFARVKEFQVPDFVLSGLRGAFAVEATTANPAQGGAVVQPPHGAAELTAYMENYVPIKIARALKRKLNKAQAYWEIPDLQDLPFVIAVQDFHAAGSMRMVVPATTEYVFGVRHSIVDSHRHIEPILEHRYGALVEPSGFFALPNSENISAVLVNPQGTLVKFNRLGYVAGFGDRRVRMTRFGFRRRDGDLVDPRPQPFRDDVHAPGYQETWVEGAVVLHNPQARCPLDPALLPGVSHEFLQPDGRIMSLIPDVPVLFSQTSIQLQGDEGPDAED